jgi:hypothetical protein
MGSETHYTCSVCGQQHDDWPAIAWLAPVHYDRLSDEDKEDIAKLETDFCRIEHPPGEMSYFIRCTLEQKVNGHDSDLDYGVWVSLSEESFSDYVAHYEDRDYETSYFGWFCSNIPEYEKTLSIPTTVFTRRDGQRPYVVPHEDHDHPFVRDYHNGISLEEATMRVHHALAGTRQDTKDESSLG